MTFPKLSIKLKLLLAFGGLAVLVLGLAAIAVASLAEEHERFNGYLGGAAARSELLHRVQNAANARAIAVRNLVLAGTASDKEMEKTAAVAAHKMVQELLAQLKDALATSAGVTDEERNRFDNLKAVEARYAPIALDILDLALNGHRDEAVVKINSDCRPTLAALIAAADAYGRTMRVQADNQIQDAQQAFASTRTVLVSVSVVALLLAVALSLAITTSTTKPIHQAVQVAQAVAAGDLTSEIHVHGRTETDLLLLALKSMNDRLTAVVGDVRQASDSIATGSAQIAGGNADLSQRTEEQAANLQQTAASMEEMTSTVKSSAQTAQEAAHLASNASLAAQRGGEMVEKVVHTMEEISRSSNKISDIIGVIDGIAFQTNILALNAAVEAARAGEQGRGFAVVASEVRGLAQRSSAAAKEIKALINDSSQRVAAGSKLVGDTGVSMVDIVDQTKRVASLIGDISVVTAEQTGGISQVNEAVSQMDSVTQQNAALVEQSAAAAESLKAQATGLAQIVATFKLPTRHALPLPTLA